MAFILVLTSNADICPQYPSGVSLRRAFHDTGTGVSSKLYCSTPYSTVVMYKVEQLRDTAKFPLHQLQSSWYMPLVFTVPCSCGAFNQPQCRFEDPVTLYYIKRGVTNAVTIYNTKQYCKQL